MATRLGIYVDDVYHQDREGRVSTNRAFLLFACEVGRHFDATVLFGRAVRSDEPTDYVLSEAVQLVALPYYPDLKQLRGLVRALPGTARAMWSGLDRVDALWVFGPHPFEFLLMGLGLLRRKRIVVGVRQDTMTYTRRRLAHRRARHLKLAASALMDGAHRLLGRRVPATLVGPEIAARYGGDRRSSLIMTVSLVPARAVAAAPRQGAATRPARLLTIGRLDNEKNPLLVVRMLAELHRRRPGRYRLTWIGRGAMESEVRGLAAELGVDELIDFRGYLSFGEELLDLYRDAEAFVHVSWTEGVPQVLVEALACATPIVATAVGGVARLLDDGAAGLLVTAGDRDALVAAVERVVDDAELRERLTRRGLQLAAELTLEAQSARVGRFVADAVGAYAGEPPQRSRLARAVRRNSSS